MSRKNWFARCTRAKFSQNHPVSFAFLTQSSKYSRGQSGWVRSSFLARGHRLNSTNACRVHTKASNDLWMREATKEWKVRNLLRDIWKKRRKKHCRVDVAVPFATKKAKRCFSNILKLIENRTRTVKWLNYLKFSKKKNANKYFRGPITI